MQQSLQSCVCWDTKKCLSKRGRKVKQSQFKRLLDVMRGWYKEHEQEVPHDAYVCLLALVREEFHSVSHTQEQNDGEQK